MLKVILILLVFANVGISYADQPGPVYYKGSQTIGVAGDAAECFVEATYSVSGLETKIRALVSDPHGDGDILGAGPVNAGYDFKENGYKFKATDQSEKVQKLFLSTTSLALFVLDGHHIDSVTCDDMVMLQGNALVEAKEKFAHFEDNIGHENEDH